MKNLYSVLFLILSLCMFLIPTLVGTANGSPKPEIQSMPQTKEESAEDIFLVFDSASNQTLTLKATDYITGVLFAEIPASYHSEALKAQAVAAYSFAAHKRYLRQNAISNSDYDVTTSPLTDQAYLTETEAKAKYNENYSAALKAITDAVNAVVGEYLCYDNAPALCIYHAISSGSTESAENVWGKDYPYLRSVKSQGDLLAEGYISTEAFTLEQIKEAFKDSCTFNENYGDWFKTVTKTDSGMILSCNIGNTVLKGVDVRKALSLRSANFNVSFENDTFTFTVYGYGHGVGLSQYGANYMALKGADYQEILLHYYNGCELKGGGN